MTLFLIIASCICWVLSLVFLFSRQLLSPALSFCGLMLMSFAQTPLGYPLLPINSTILWGWFAMTFVVMMAIVLQAPALRAQSRGVWYMLGGGLTGLALGLLGFSLSSNISLLYGIMIVAVAAGIFLGFLLYVNTPRGAELAPGTGRFFKYLLAKGFPTAITLMQPGVVLVLLLALHSFD